MSSKRAKHEKWVRAAQSQHVQLSLAADFTVKAAAEETAQPSFRLVAYTGSPIRQAWSRNALVLDLAGMDLTNQSIPILFGHDASLENVIGQATSVTSDGSTLIVEGTVLGVSQTTQQVLELARRGMRFQASVGADVGRIENIQAGESVAVNNRTFAGPVSIVRGSALRETSIVLMGADGKTSAAIAAEADYEEVSMADNANQTPDEVKASAEATASVAVETATIEATKPVAEDKTSMINEIKDAIKAELLNDLRASRPAAPAIHVAEPVNGENVIEAALCMQAGLPSIDKAFDERTIEAAAKVKRDISISQVILKAAKANGYTGSDRVASGNMLPILTAAFATHQIGNLLEAAVNKFLLAGFNAVEQVWPQISTTRSVNDFKAINLYRLNGSFKFSKVGNAGELKVAAASDSKRSLAAETYGITTQLTRQDIINDDLNALSLIPQRIGRGAALSLNEVIWAEFLSSNDTFYQKAAAAAGNALSFTSLSTAATAFRKLTDPDGNPLGIQPRILLVPPELELTAAQLMTQSMLIASGLSSTSAKTVEPSANVLQGRYRVVVSNYLTSASTWWLMADASDLNALDVVFLNGQQVPTIEQVQPDYNLLGVAMRGYFDFGVSKAESLSCYRMATA